MRWLHYLPSPLDIPPVKGTDLKGNEVARPADDKAPFAGLAFKIMDDPFVGSITFVRVYSGSISSGTGALNSVKDKTERVGRMLLMHANSREDVKEANAGDIVAFAGLKLTTTGETLCDPNNPVILERMEFPDPVIEVAIEPKTKADQEKMGMALVRLAQEDPSFRVSTDQESGQTILKGMGELHLEIKVDILKRTYKVDANVGAPQVAYRETLSQAGHDQIHPQEADRRFGPVRRSHDRIRAAAAGFGLRVRERSRRRRHPQGIHPLGGKGPEGAEGIRPARRLPGDRLPGDARSTASITKSTPTR